MVLMGRKELFEGPVRLTTADECSDHRCSTVTLAAMIRIFFIVVSKPTMGDNVRSGDAPLLAFDNGDATHR
jgi:hypothetical protein